MAHAGYISVLRQKAQSVEGASDSLVGIPVSGSLLPEKCEGEAWNVSRPGRPFWELSFRLAQRADCCEGKLWWKVLDHQATTSDIKTQSRDLLQLQLTLNASP